VFEFPATESMSPEGNGVLDGGVGPCLDGEFWPD
jgi:hypothetical protein